MVVYPIVGADRTVVLRAFKGFFEIQKLEHRRHVRPDVGESQRATDRHGDLAAENQELYPGRVNLVHLAEIQLDDRVRGTKYRQ